METSRLRRATALALGFALVGGAGVFAGTLTVRPGVPNVGGLARYTGNHGLEVDVANPDRNPAYVQSSHPVAESVYRLRFFVNLRGLTMVDGNEFDIFAASDGADPTPPATTGNVLFRIGARQTAGKKVLSAFVRTDVGSETQIPSEVILADGWRMVEVDWAKSTAGGTGTGNGHFTLWVDGVQKANLGSLDNDNGTLNYARLGAVNGVDAATSGTLKFDDFASQRTGYIGVIQLFSDVPTSYASSSTSRASTPRRSPPGAPSASSARRATSRASRWRSSSSAPPTERPSCRRRPTGIFSDVSTGSFTAPYIEQLFHDGVTSGCATSPARYCPSDPVTRAQMAVFLLRAEHGSPTRRRRPPGSSATSRTDFTRPFIEQLYNEAFGRPPAAPPRRCATARRTR